MKLRFPNLESDFFVTFDHLELMRLLLIVEVTSFQFFRLCASSRNFHKVKESPLLS